jgi:thiol-disulfide isomerase/thioredoxin
MRLLTNKNKINKQNITIICYFHSFCNITTQNKIFKMKKIIFIFSFIISSISFIASSQNYTIKVKVDGLSNSNLNMGHYYGQHQYIKDTVTTDANGIGIFESDTAWPGGIYFIVFPNQMHFEFIMNGEKEMSFETDTINPATGMNVKESKENKIFYEYIQFIQSKQENLQLYQKKVDEFKESETEDSLGYYSELLDAVTKEIQTYKLSVIKKHPESLSAYIFLASKTPEIPKEIPLLENGKEDSTFAYRYYKSHYFEHIDFTDDRILRTPIFYGKLNDYLFNVIPQHPDSAIIEVDKMIEAARPNKEMFKYILWFTTYKYETCGLMGFDAVFVHLVNTYYKTDQAWWVEKASLNHMIERSNKLEPILLGNVAPNMIIIDTTYQLISMHAIEANYTILIFWEPDCGHCMKEIPRLSVFYKKNKEKYDMEVFAICTDTSLNRWKNYVNEYDLTWINANGTRSATANFHDLYDIYSTPVVYILDKDKKILAKRLSVEQTEEFIEKQYQEAIKEEE